MQGKGQLTLSIHLHGLLLARSVLAGENLLAVLVELELGDDAVGSVDADLASLAGDLFTVEALDVDDVSLSVA